MKLQTYLDRNKISQSAMAKALGISAVAVHRYVRGTRLPEHAVLAKLLTLTDGQVTPNDFYEIPTTGVSDHADAA